MSEMQPATPAEAAPVAETSPATEPSVLNQPTTEKTTETPTEPAGAPEAYSDWKMPEGYEIDTEAKTEADTIFKELNLTQDQGQKLIDMYAKYSKASAEESAKVYNEYRDSQRAAVKADPEIGGKLDQVKTTVARAINELGDPALAKQFRQDMDYTGAGDTLSFIKVFYKLAQAVTEGQHVTGGGPSVAGQRPDGKAQPTSIAAAIYGPDGPKGSLKGA